MHGTAMKMKIRTKDGFRVTHINRRRSIRLFCIECVGFEFSEVDNCNGKMIDGAVCPLVEFKTGQGNQKPKARRNAIIKHCRICMGGNIQLVGQCVSPLCPVFPYRQHGTDMRLLFPDSKSGSDILETDLQVSPEIFKIAV